MGKLLSGSKWRILIIRSISMLGWICLLLSWFMVVVVADRKSLIHHNSSSLSLSSSLSSSSSSSPPISLTENYVPTTVHFAWQSHHSTYRHVWPKLRFSWRIVVGTIIGFLGAAFGSVGGVGGGGIFVPMLDLIVGFDPKSSTAISKCMIMGASMSTVYYNLKLRHPTLEMPLIDYDLAVLFQPMLMLGISIGVALNIIFADWMVTILLILLFLVTSTKACLKGIETWKKETVMLKEAALHLQLSNVSARSGSGVDFRPLPSSPIPNIEEKDPEAPIIENVYWKKLGLLFFVWVSFLIVQITKRKLATCSITYWIVNLLQIPISVGVTLFEAISIYKGKRRISSRGDATADWKIHQLCLYCFLGILAGMVGGLLGLGGGFILGPLFLEMGVPPQVSSATATFAMTFSSSMSVIEYYILKRFPVPYALYFIVVAITAAFVGQHVVRRIINVLGRASLIIFILAFTIFVSAISLGGVGIFKTVTQIKRDEYMGFDNFCTYKDA